MEVINEAFLYEPVDKHLLNKMEYFRYLIERDAISHNKITNDQAKSILLLDEYIDQISVEVRLRG
jgi:hypothetical protein